MKSDPKTLIGCTVGEGIGASGTWRAVPQADRLRIVAWAVWVAVATVAFGQPLIRLMLHAAQSDLYSYIPLVPLVVGYLLFIRPGSVETAYRTSVGGTVILVGTCVAALTAGTAWRGSLSVNDGFALIALAYVSVVAAGGFLFLGSKWMAAAAFPLAFMIFLVPLPDAAVYWLERASVLASADVSASFFRMTGTPLVRNSEVFMLPGIVLTVAQECSGIRSSWVLFITSLLASHLFLASPWRKFVLVAFVIPLAIVRNAFRILIIGLLCVHVGPHMLNSVVHRHGGPFFFALSLGPLFLFLMWLRRQER